MDLKISDSELEFIETLYNPIAFGEVIFSNFDNLTLMEEDKLASIRLGQYPLLSFEYLLDNNPDLSQKQNFQLRKRVGDMWALGGRLFGKTLVALKLDLLTSMIWLNSEKSGFSSYDAIHIKSILEDIIQVLDHHPFYQLFEPQTTRHPNFRFLLKNGYLLEGINMNITGKGEGAQFFQKHLHRLYIEEASFESYKVYQQRRDSVSEWGCVYRISGMTNFTKYSPCGQAFYDLSKRRSLVNLPQKINPNWDDKKRQDAIKDFGGEGSINYRIFVDGDVVEEGASVFDIERVRKNYSETRKIKFFEVNKKNFEEFPNILILDRPKNADACIISADIGESAPTEITVIFHIDKKYRYEYNIILYNLTDKQQFRIFKYLKEVLNADYIGIDCTDGMGRAIFRSLEEIYPKEMLVWVGFNEKIAVDFEKNDKGEVVFQDGKPVFKEEYVRDWSIHNLKTLLYGERMDLPLDYKFDMQINSVISMNSGTRVIYHCNSPEDHLFQSFQVFSIVQWMVEFKLLKPVMTKKFAKRGV